LKRFSILLASFAVLVAVAPAAFAAAHPMHEAQPAIAFKAKGFGTIVATKKHLALYTWKKEKAGTIKCTGACAKMWPPIVVPAHTMVAKHVKGVMGTFGKIQRPDGHTQLTLNRHALYTYEGDTPTKILCNGVDGWFVVKA
jgi:predicted lipoprotein with Yx(FWY)xxD motif